MFKKTKFKISVIIEQLDGSHFLKLTVELI